LQSFSAAEVTRSNTPLYPDQRTYLGTNVYARKHNFNSFFVPSSVPDPGSGAFLPLGSGSGMNFFRISDPGSKGYVFW
jgi:hypothetical protein